MKNFILISLCLIKIQGFLFAQELETEQLKIINYNTLYGFNHNKSIEEGVKWIKKEKPDLVFLTEMKGFDNASIKKIGQRWGHPYTHFWKRKGAAMPLAITSTKPILNIKEVKTVKQHKGFLMCKTQGYGFVLVHLHPNNIKHRKNEVKVLLNELKPWEKQKIPYAILGDFNAMSLKDKAYYDKYLGSRLKEKIAKNKCSDLIKCKEWDYSVMNLFFEFGLRDNHYLKTNEIERNSVDQFYGTFPSTVLEKIYSQNQKDHLHRIDYCLGNSSFFANTTSCKVARDPVLEKISDHYPIVTKVIKPN